MAGLSLRWDAVLREVPGVLREVTAALTGRGFYLAGGTALALHLGHRVSEDLDLFSTSFGDPEALAADLAGIPGLEVGLVDRRTLYTSLRGVHVSFLGYVHPLLEPPLEGDELLPIATIADIAAMKLAAVASRGSRKDFVDLWCVVGTGRTLRELLDLYSRKFRTRDVGHLVRSLTYFDDAEEEPPLRLLVDAPWERVKGDLVRWVEELLAKS